MQRGKISRIYCTDDGGEKQRRVGTIRVGVGLYNLVVFRFTFRYVFSTQVLTIEGADRDDLPFRGTRRNT